MHLQSLRSNVSREAALAAFRGRGPAGWLRTALHGPLRSVADVYVPFRLFRVHIDTGNGERNEVLALDAVTGNFDLYAFPSTPSNGELVNVITRNCPPATIDADQAVQLMTERVRRMAYSGGFFRLRRLEILVEPAGLDFHVPYWVAFSGWGEQAHLVVMDAVRRRMEGAKVREAIKAWVCGAMEAIAATENPAAAKAAPFSGSLGHS